MKQTIRIGLKPGQKKRGRPRKVKANTLAKMQQDNDPNITFVRDLIHHDRTAVTGKDDNFVYRWCRADRIAERERQGYVRVDDENVKSCHDGNFWNPEGKDARLAKGGNVLMKIKKDVSEMRQRIKEEQIEDASVAEDARLRYSLVSEGSSVLPDSDEFMQELANR